MDMSANSRRCHAEFEARREADEINSRHRLPIRFAEDESDAPEFLCKDCEEVEVSDLDERCAECQIQAEEAAREDHYEFRRELREGR